MKNGREHSWGTVVIEDQALFRDLLIQMLKDDTRFDLLGHSMTAEDGLALCLEHKPDLILLDIQLPDRDGVEMAHELQQKLPETRILAVTTLTDPDTINRILDAGIQGYVEKEQELPTLIQAMVRVASGGHFRTERVSHVTEAFAREPLAYPKILSRREQDIVRLVAHGFTSKQIATKLKISQRTIENHRYRIMQKLELKNTVELTSYAWENGLIKSGEK